MGTTVLSIQSTLNTTDSDISKFLLEEYSLDISHTFIYIRNQICYPKLLISQSKIYFEKSEVFLIEKSLNVNFSYTPGSILFKLHINDA